MRRDGVEQSNKSPALDSAVEKDVGTLRNSKAEAPLVDLQNPMTITMKSREQGTIQMQEDKPYYEEHD